MKIILYCQYVWGMGHLVRSLEFARALSKHTVSLIAGGQKVDLNLPGNVEFLRLPVLYMDEKFTRLIPGVAGKSVEKIRRERQEILYRLFEKNPPDIFVIELYPFGRSIFGFELDPLLKRIRDGKFGAIKTVCSLRDILVEKKDPAAYEERVLQKLNRFFDVLLVHSDASLMRLDETFSRVGDIAIPVVYTGFIAQHAVPGGGLRLRRELNISSGEKLIVASAGGGRSGYHLLRCVLDACESLRERIPLRLEAFAGPFMESEEFARLSSRRIAGLRIRRYTKRFLDYLQAADLSISLAGYNTCMNLLVTGVPALVYPYSRQQEQPLRADKIKGLLPLKILGQHDVEPVRLCGHIEDMLRKPRSAAPPELNLNGAATAADFLTGWAKSFK